MNANEKVRLECEHLIAVAMEMNDLREQIKGARVLADANSELRHNMARWQRELKR